MAVRAGLEHRGAARVLVHHLKYRGLTAAGRPLGAAMAARLVRTASVLVPVPRAVVRHMRFGIDPARFLAGEVARLSGLPVVDALRPGWWWARHAPRAPEARGEPRFVAVRSVPSGAVLVDDVARTGITFDAAAAALGAEGLSALAATAPHG
jgi:predicted amidophosphoribosyltransferase